MERQHPWIIQQKGLRHPRLGCTWVEPGDHIPAGNRILPLFNGWKQLSGPPQLAPREDSLIKAWKTVSEIDALLGTDFRPSMPTCAEEDGQGQGLTGREGGSAASGGGLRLSRGSSHVDDSYVKVRTEAARPGAVRQGVTYATVFRAPCGDVCFGHKGQHADQHTPSGNRPSWPRRTRAMPRWPTPTSADLFCCMV